MNDKPLTIRTLDIGADKEVECLSLLKEDNPFLGYRAIRICLNDHELFKTQLRAIFRASEFGKIRIMFPMITGVDELQEVIKIFDEVKKELVENKINFDDKTEIGIMIEVPSAAYVAEDLIKLVDFFSIGTNDLTQYMLAVDRGNEQISNMYDYFHPAVLRLIAHVIKVSNNHSKHCSVCGEMGSDLLALPILLGMGLRSVSMNPPAILQTKALLEEISIKEADDIFNAIIKLNSANEIREVTKKMLPDAFFEKTK